MKTRASDNWKCQWTNMGSAEQDNYIAMFSCPHMRANILYPLSELQEILENDTPCAVPREVIKKALYAYDVRVSA